MDTEALRDIGLSETEVKVYLALLELGSALAGEITKKSGVNRTNVYDALERLIEKGLVSFILSANRKVFQPVNPKRFQELLDEKKENLQDILVELQQKFDASKVKEEATLFKGKKGIKSVFEDILKEGKDLYIYGAESRFTALFPVFQKHWHRKRVKKGLKIRMIYSKKIRPRKKEKEKLGLMKIRFLPVQYEFPSTVLIYPPKVVTIVWTENPLGFLIKSEEVAKTNLNFFEILWKGAKK